MSDSENIESLVDLPAPLSIYQRLISIIEDLRSENAFLLDILFKSRNITSENKEDQIIVAAESVDSGHLGNTPWSLRKKRLELLYKKNIEENKEETENK